MSVIPLPPYLGWTPADATADLCAAQGAKADDKEESSENHLRREQGRAEIVVAQQAPQCTNSSGVPDFAPTTRMTRPAAWVPARADIMFDCSCPPRRRLARG